MIQIKLAPLDLLLQLSVTMLTSQRVQQLLGLLNGIIQLLLTIILWKIILRIVSLSRWSSGIFQNYKISLWLCAILTIHEELLKFCLQITLLEVMENKREYLLEMQRHFVLTLLFSLMTFELMRRCKEEVIWLWCHALYEKEHARPSIEGMRMATRSKV